MKYFTSFPQNIKYILLSMMIFIIISCGNNSASIQDTNNSSDISVVQDNNLTNVPDTVDTNTTGTNKPPIPSTDKNETVDDNNTLGNDLPWVHGALKVSLDKRRVEHSDGTGFFFMADTAWSIFETLDENSVDLYLRNRKKLGFNVIFMRAVEDQAFDEHPDFGLPFGNNDAIRSNRVFSNPNERFWNNVDNVIKKAEDLGIYVALLPSWNMTFNRIGTFKTQGLTTEKEATEYGTWIANRYKDKPNIIWVMGGDSGPGNPAGGDFTTDEAKRTALWEKKKPIWKALATSIRQIVKNKQLITFHPSGGVTSKDLFENTTWMDFHLAQSGHCKQGSVDTGHKIISQAYTENILPIVDGEPKYESIVKCFYLENDSRNDGTRFSGEDLLETAYRQVFSGAFGYTYGHHSIWLFWEKEGDNFSSSKPNISWQNALDVDGAKYMGYLVKLMKSRPLASVPDTSILIDKPNEQYTHALALKGDGYLFVYQPKNKEVSVDLSKLSDSEDSIRYQQWSYNPLTGKSKKKVEHNSTNIVLLPSSDKNKIVVFDDISKKYLEPGSFYK